jgi:hypothetical protein
VAAGKRVDPGGRLMATSSDWWSQHGTHTLFVAAPVAAVAMVGLAADARAWLRRRHLDPVLALAAAGSVIAAGVHVAVCPEHYGEGWLYGAFFTVTATAQLLWAALLMLRPDPRVVRAGLVATLALVALWAVTRTAGIPLGPERGEVEEVGALDAVATTCEALVVMASAWALTRSGRQDHRRAVAE